MEDLDPHVFGAGQPCFGCSPEHPFGFHLRFAKDGDEVVTHFTPGAQYQGPPGIMHGGLVTTLADEIGAWAVIALLGRFGFTASLAAKLHKPVRIGVPLEGRARIARDAGRVAKVTVTITQEAETAFTGEFSFVVLDQAGAEKLLGGPLPEAWKKFARSSTDSGR